MKNIKKLHNIINKAYSEKYIVNFNGYNISLEKGDNKAAGYISFSNDSYLIHLEDITPLIKELNLNINSEGLDLFISKYEELCFRYGIFNKIKSPKKIAEKTIKELIIEKKGIIIYKNVYGHTAIKNYSNLNLRFKLSKNLEPIYELYVPITPFRKIYINIHNDITKNDYEEIFKKLEKKIKNFSIQIIKANFENLEIENLKQMAPEEIKQYIDICKLINY